MRLEKRFATHMTQEQCARITFLPHAGKERFLQILLAVDAILDTVHFTFGTTALLTLSMNLPFVTWPGEFMRGRQSLGFYQIMKMSDLVAATYEEYVGLALRLANDKAFRAEMSEKIRSRRHVLFDDYAVIGSFAASMKELYARSV